MNVLVMNAGSSSLKCEVVRLEPPVGDLVRGVKLARGSIDPVRDYADAARKLIADIDAVRVPGFSGTSDVHWIGHRVVHGGPRFSQPARIDDDVLSAIEQLDDLAPLHNAKSLEVIRASQMALPNTPAVAVFDTAFHRTMPDASRRYPIPWELAERHEIHRYGFHGISHQYLMMRYSEITRTRLDSTNIITLHLSGGSSATAVSNGKSVDTSMGFTPLEGLMMCTRSGDVDPGIVGFLARKERVDVHVVEEWLNKQSGLLGLSGLSQDTRVLAKAKANARAQLALEMFSYRARKYIGAFLAAMGGANAVVFSGAIGENSPDVRMRICQGLEWLGLELDPERNASVTDRQGLITRDGARLHAYVIPTEEGLMIAHETARCCGSQNPGENRL